MKHVTLNCVCIDVCVCGLQVYTVGPDYAHAEARKSPALDGKVERDSEGKEIRYPVMLSAMEKLVARKVCLAFKVTYSLQGSTVTYTIGPLQGLIRFWPNIKAV